jgi:hypothetical protein
MKEILQRLINMMKLKFGVKIPNGVSIQMVFAYKRRNKWFITRRQ